MIFFSLSIFISVTYSVPIEITIEYGEACTENWDCTDWSACVGGVQTRTCTDLNECGTEINKPSESQVCTVEPTTGGPSVGGPIFGGSTISEPELEPEPEISAEPVISDIEISLDAPYEIESGEPFTATVAIKNKATYTQDVKVKIRGIEKVITLKTNEEGSLFFDMHAPERGGIYNLVAEAYDNIYSRTSKQMMLTYKPLFLYVTPITDTMYQIRVKNFENQSTTEINILREEENVYFEVLNGSIDYRFNLTFEQSGDYEIITKARIGLDLIDEDKRRFTIEEAAIIQEKKLEFSNLIILILLLGGIPIIVILVWLFKTKRLLR